MRKLRLLSGVQTLMERPGMRSFSDRLLRFCKAVILVCALAAFSYIALTGLFLSVRLSITEASQEALTYLYDNYILNVLVSLAAFFFVALLLNRVLDRIDPVIFAAVMLTCTFILSGIWEISVQSLPAHDSYSITSSAAAFAKGDYTALAAQDSYFRYYPFQLGYTLVCELFYRLLGNGAIAALWLLNMLSLVMIYAGIIRIAFLAFPTRRTVNLTTLFLFFFLPGIFFTTFIYGNLPGFAFAVWAVCAILGYFKTGKKRFVFTAAVLIGIAVMIKSNNMIVLVAMCIMLLLHFFERRRLFSLAALLLCLVVGTGLLNGVIASYEARADVSLGGGVPKILWLNIGLHESNGCGWYNSAYSVSLFTRNGYDGAAAAKEGREQIREQLQHFWKNPDEANAFFTKKLASTWNEPTYASVWVSQTRGHLLKELPGYVKSMYEGTLGKALYVFMNQYANVLFLSSAAAVLFLFKRRNTPLLFVCLIVFGGFLYHLLFETKSQYVITYVMLAVPLAAYGMDLLAKRFCNKRREYTP